MEKQFDNNTEMAHMEPVIEPKPPHCRHIFTAWILSVHPMGYRRQCIFCGAWEVLPAFETRGEPFDCPASVNGV